MNIKSGNQYGIVQVNPDMRNNKMPEMTTTEFPDIDDTTTALPDENTTYEFIDLTEDYSKDSVVGK